MRRKFYVTIQLSNGGIESLFIDLNEGELATEEMFADKIEEWWHMNCKYMSDSDKYIESHIIAWSQMNNYALHSFIYISLLYNWSNDFRT